MCITPGPLGPGDLQREAAVLPIQPRPDRAHADSIAFYPRRITDKAAEDCAHSKTLSRGGEVIASWRGWKVVGIIFGPLGPGDLQRRATAPPKHRPTQTPVSAADFPCRGARRWL